MRQLLFGAVAAATIFAAPQAMAQFGVYVGPGGAGVEFGRPYGFDSYAPRYYAPRGRYYRGQNNDSYTRWRKEGNPHFETER